MTERMAYYLQLVHGQGLITTFTFLFVGGLMGCWYVLSGSPIPFFRKLSRGPFWTFVLLLDIGLFTYLAFFYPKG